RGRRVGPGPEVVRVVRVLRRAGPGQPALVHLQRGDRRDVARADVAGRPARGEGRPGEQRGVVSQPHRPHVPRGQPAGGRGGQRRERGGPRGVPPRRASPPPPPGPPPPPRPPPP